MLDREQRDQEPGHEERRIVPALGDAERRDLVRNDPGGESPAVVQHHRPERADEDEDHHFDATACLVGDQHQQRLHADVTRVAHADGSADQRDVEDDDQRQALGPRRRVVQHVAAEHLPGDEADDCPQAADGREHREASERGVEAGEHMERGETGGIAPPIVTAKRRWVPACAGTTKSSLARHFVACTFTSMSFSFGSLMNLSYTGFIASWNDFLSTSMTCDPVLTTRSRDFFSISSQSLRMYGTDSFAASRKIFCSSGV